MQLKHLLHRLTRVESLTHSAVFSLAQARVLFPDEKDQALRNALGRHTASGNLRKVCTGVWLNNLSRFLGEGYLLHQVAALLRPSDFNYISMESVLADAGIISQQLQGYLTVVTSGCGHLYKTTLGTIEFTSTKIDPRDLLTQTLLISGSPLRRATIARAWADLQKVRRNIQMVDTQELEQALRHSPAVT